MEKNLTQKLHSAVIMIALCPPTDSPILLTTNHYDSHSISLAAIKDGVTDMVVGCASKRFGWPSTHLISCFFHLHIHQFRIYILVLSALVVREDNIASLKNNI